MSADGRFGRRSLLALSSALCLTRHASARSRLPLGGKISFRIPFATSSIDPHRLDDPAAAIFGDGLFDTLYAREGGAIVPSLAEGEPKLENDTLVVSMRRGLLSAEGRPVDARDAVFALGRARRFGARAWLTDLGNVERVSNEALRFSLKDPARLMTLLAAPLAAIVPLAFSPERPDGTGPFQGTPRADALTLARNVRGARGPALLDDVIVRSAPDLAASLRAFETGTDDLGWLGAGLYSPRRGSKPFDAGPVAWVVLRLGRDAASWDTPGTAQQIVDALPPNKLAHLGLGPAWNQGRDVGWGGPVGELLVRDDAPYLVEVARTVAALLSRAGHELTVKPVPHRELSSRCGKREFMLMLDLVRPLGAGATAAYVALSSSDEAATESAAKPPRVAENTAVRALTRTMRIGVIGSLHVQGARIAELTIPTGESGSWDLGSIVRARRTA